MSSLHLINHPRLLKPCIDGARLGDAILLYENGVLAGSVAGMAGWIEQLEGIELFALEVDVAAAGLEARLHPRVREVNDHDFVDLVVRHHKTVSWS